MENTDIALVKKEVTPFSERITEVYILAEELKIEDKNTQKNGEKLLKTIQSLAREIDEKKKSIMEKPKEYIDMVNSVVKETTQSLDIAKSILTKKLLTRDEETDDVKGVTHLFKIEIEDETQVPIEFCSPDPAKIRTAIKAGAEIPGVKKVDYKIVK